MSSTNKEIKDCIRELSLVMYQSYCYCCLIVSHFGLHWDFRYFFEPQQILLFEVLSSDSPEIKYCVTKMQVSRDIEFQLQYNSF